VGEGRRERGGGRGERGRIEEGVERRGRRAREGEEGEREGGDRRY
jgi:hypothetical protein